MFRNLLRNLKFALLLLHLFIITYIWSIWKFWSFWNIYQIYYNSELLRYYGYKVIMVISFLAPMWWRLRTIRCSSCFLIESVVFVKKGSLQKKMQREDVFVGLTIHNFPEDGGCNQCEIVWMFVKSIRWFKSFIKFGHNILREF